MKKSVRNIVSLVTSTCLVASLGAFSINADEISESVTNDVAVEQNASNNAVAETIAKFDNTNNAVIETIANNNVASTEDSSQEDEVIATDVNVKITYNAANDEVTNDVTDINNEVTVETDVTTISSNVTTDNNVATTKQPTTDVTTKSNNDGVVSNQVTTIKNNTPDTTTKVNVDVSEGVTEAVTETVIATTKDIVLTLDVSDSMEGEPKELVRKTATDLVNKILSEDSNTKIALVGFNDSAYHIYSYDEENDEYITYFDNAEDLIDAINNILDKNITLDNPDLEGEGGTDFLNALYEVKFLLETGDGEEKSVVIMTDGVSAFGTDDGEISDAKYVNQEFADFITQSVIDFADEEIKPLATIYTIGYFQNLEKESQELEDAKYLLETLATKDENGENAKYYEANDKNIDEITNLIAEDIVHHPISKQESKSTDKSPTIGDSDTSDSPNTSDAGVAPIVMVSALAGAMLVISKKNK